MTDADVPAETLPTPAAAPAPAERLRLLPPMLRLPTWDRPRAGSRPRRTRTQAAARGRVPPGHQDLQRRTSPNAFTAIRDVSFVVEDQPDKGEFICVLGTERLRQEHDPAADRRPGAAASADRGRRAGAGPAGAWARSGPRHGLPGLHQLRPPHRAGQRHVRPGVPRRAAQGARRSWAASGSSASA